MGKFPKQNKVAQGSQLSRKQKRKQERKNKRSKKKLFHQKSSNKANSQSSQINKAFQGNDRMRNNSKTNTSDSMNRKTLNAPFKTQNRIGNDDQRLVKASKKGEKVYKKKIEAKNEDNEEVKQIELQRQQKQIEYYEKLLGLDKKKNKYKSFAKDMGYQDDLFDFLDNISKKVKQPHTKGTNPQNYDDDSDQQDQEALSQQEMQEEDLESEMQLEDLEQENSQGEQQMDQIDQQQRQLWQQLALEGDQRNQEQQQQYLNQDKYSSAKDNQSYQSASQEDPQIDGQSDFYQENTQNNANSLTNNKKTPINKQSVQIPKTKQQNQVQKPTKLQRNVKISSQKQVKLNSQVIESRRPLFGNLTVQQKEQNEIRKQMNSLFNKLSDGNLMITFRQFSQIFLSSSKSNTIPVFIKLFSKFNIEVEKPHLHILLSNISLASALHHLVGNRLMAPLVYEIVKKFIEYESTDQNQEQVQQIGYSRLFQKKKNALIILSYLYDFKSLTGQFISSLVKHLAGNLNEHNIQFLYLIIQKIGNKIRQNDPGVLKQIIDVLRQSIQKFKNEQGSQNAQTTKINIIELELNELKFNRRMQLFSDQRMAFFSTFLTKNIPKQINSEKQVLLPNFQQINSAGISRTNWWEYLQSGNHKQQRLGENEEDLQMVNELTSERKQLIDLAKSLNLVTEVRKNIFIEIMEASDYIQATQKVLSLKIKNLQQIAIVLVQVCVLEPTFNPFYPLVAAKISNLMPKFKSKVQFAIWDHIKLLESYDARKNSNLAKFTARFIGNPLSNGSLSILKHFADLINIHPFESMFLMIFFTEFFSVTKKQMLVQISSKLKEESNRQIKEAILEYFSQVGARQKGFNNLDKIKFLRRMIMLNEEQKQEGQRS